MADDAYSIDDFADYFARPFSLDLRSLALLRVGLGVVVILDLINRGLWLQAHYTDFGVMPREALLDTRWNPAWLSVHLYNGLYWPTLLLFALAAVLAILMIVGYRTTLVTFASWFLMISLQARNPMVLQGGDIVFRLLLFWAIFLPIGARWSVDAALDPEGEPSGVADNRYFSSSTVTYIAQIVFIYLFAALLKTGAEWRSEFSATYYALSLDQFTTPIGDWLWHQNDVVLQTMTVATYGIEAFGWALLLLPLLTLPFLKRSNAFFRMLAVVVFVGMHLSFAVTMRLGLFSYIVSVGWLALLPGWFWERLAERFSGFGDDYTIRVSQEYSESPRETLARLARGLLLLPHAELVPEDVDESEDDHSVWTVVDPSGDEHPGADGLVVLLDASPVYGPVYRLGERFLSAADRLENAWDSWRGSGNLRELLDRAFPIRPYYLGQTLVGAAVCSMALLGAFWWNMQTVDSRYQMLQPWRTFAVYARLDQKWSMFAPFPLKEDGWYVIPGTLRSGERVSLFQKPHREPPEWDKPDDVSATYPNQRWRKYMMNIWMADHSDQRLYYGRWMCRRWNRDHSDEDELVTFKIYFMKEVSKPDHVVPEPEKVHLWTHHCFKDPDEEKEDDEKEGDEKEGDEKEGDRQNDGESNGTNDAGESAKNEPADPSKALENLENLPLMKGDEDSDAPAGE